MYNSESFYSSLISLDVIIIKTDASKAYWRFPNVGNLERLKSSIVDT
jgi:hypothetical protein